MLDLSRAFWRTSSRSGTGNNCVQVASVPGVIGIRDSKDLGGKPIVLSASQWEVFADQVKDGQHDL
jgi:hypothetical protein